MLTIPRKGKRTGGNHKVYTRAEADALGIQYTRDWRNMLVWQWALTDDGYVGQLVHDNWAKKPDKNGIKTRFMHFSFGSITNVSRELRFRKMIRCTGSLNGVPRDVNFLKQVKSKVFVYFYCYSIIQYGKVDYEKLGMMIASGPLPAVRAKIMLRSPRIQSQIAQAMKDILLQEGISMESIIKDYNKIKKKAIDEGKYKDAMEILDRFERLVGMPDGLPQNAKNGLPEGSKGNFLTSGGLESRLEEMAKFANDPLHAPEGVRNQKNVKNAVQVYDEEGNPISEFPDRSEDVDD